MREIPGYWERAGMTLLSSKEKTAMVAPKSLIQSRHTGLREINRDDSRWNKNWQNWGKTEVKNRFIALGAWGSHWMLCLANCSLTAIRGKAWRSWWGKWEKQWNWPDNHKTTQKDLEKKTITIEETRWQNIKTDILKGGDPYNEVECYSVKVLPALIEGGPRVSGSWLEGQPFPTELGQTGLLWSSFISHYQDCDISENKNDLSGVWNWGDGSVTAMFAGKTWGPRLDPQNPCQVQVLWHVSVILELEGWRKKIPGTCGQSALS